MISAAKDDVIMNFGQHQAKRIFKMSNDQQKMLLDQSIERRKKWRLFLAYWDDALLSYRFWFFVSSFSYCSIGSDNKSRCFWSNHIVEDSSISTNWHTSWSSDCSMSDRLLFFFCLSIWRSLDIMKQKSRRWRKSSSFSNRSSRSEIQILEISLRTSKNSFHSDHCRPYRTSKWTLKSCSIDYSLKLSAPQLSNKLSMRKSLAEKNWSPWFSTEVENQMQRHNFIYLRRRWPRFASKHNRSIVSNVKWERSTRMCLLPQRKLWSRRH